MSSYYQHSTAHAWRPPLGLRSYVSSVRTSTSACYETDETDPCVTVCKGYRRLAQTGGSLADKEELAPITGTN